jgi:hypothetical protein
LVKEPFRLKTLNESFTDQEFEALKQTKGKLNWHDYIMLPAMKPEENFNFKRIADGFTTNIRGRRTGHLFETGNVIHESDVIISVSSGLKYCVVSAKTITKWDEFYSYLCVIKEVKTE